MWYNLERKETGKRWYEGMSAMNILVCDDEIEIADAIKIYLENEGYSVFKAANGLEAIAQLDKYEIHLIIMDIMMPKMDGIKATMKIREEHHIPLIMLSAKSEDYDKILGLNIGADDYVTKPFNPLELIASCEITIKKIYGTWQYGNETTYLSNWWIGIG